MKKLQLKEGHFNLAKELKDNGLNFNIGGSYSLKPIT